MLKNKVKLLKREEQRYIEGYAAALHDVYKELTGDNWCAKHYDPMTCESKVLHSYAFNMKDGGRHHNVSDYKDLEEIKNVLLGEILKEIKNV